MTVCLQSQFWLPKTTQRTHEKFYTDIWANETIWGLAWHCNRSWMNTRNRGYLASSWTWASIHILVWFCQPHSRLCEVCAAKNSVAVILKGLNPYGEVFGGTLSVSDPSLHIIGHNTDLYGLASVIAQTNDKSIKVRSVSDYEEAHDAKGIFLAILSFGWTIDHKYRVIHSSLWYWHLMKTVLFPRTGMSKFIVDQPALGEVSARHSLENISGTNEKLMKAFIKVVVERESTVV